MPIEQSKAIVLRTTRYGDSSLVVLLFTEKFGVESFMAKGVRKQAKSLQNNGAYYQPGCIIDLVFYKNGPGKLHLIKEAEWAHAYQTLLYDVGKNAIAQFIVELIQNSVHEPEPNIPLFQTLVDSLKFLDGNSLAQSINLPLYFMLQLGKALGFELQGSHSPLTPYLDMREGCFCATEPNHPLFLGTKLSLFTSHIQSIEHLQDLSATSINRPERRILFERYAQFLSLHLSNFRPLKTLSVLHVIFG